MKPKKAIKELRKQLKGDPGNVVVKIRLASLLRDVGEFAEAVQLYLAVAQAYQSTERVGQAIAVCKGILEFVPQDGATHQMLSYLEQCRLQAEMEEKQALMAATPGYDSPPPGYEPPSPVYDSPHGYESPPPGESRRNRPTSFPTPLSDAGRPGVSGASNSPTGRLGRQRIHRPSEPALTMGYQRNSRPTDLGHTMSTRRVEDDVTVPGAPPTRPTNEFRLRDLSAAASARAAGEVDKSDEKQSRTQPKMPKVSPPAPPRPAASTQSEEGLTQPKIARVNPPRQFPLSGQAPPPSPIGGPSRTENSDGKTVATKRAARPSFQPPALAPAPTPAPTPEPTTAPRPAAPTARPSPAGRRPEPFPHDQLSPPPLPEQGRDEEESDEPSLEDATIVDANFDMAKFILSQSSEEAEPSDAELPDIPGLAKSQEVTRVADPEPSGVTTDMLAALRRLPEYAVNALAAGARLHEYPADYMVTNEGSANDTCFILCSGEVQILKRNALKHRANIKEAARLSAGGLFGEYALVGDRRCLASVQTVVPSTVVEIPRSCISDLTTRFPGLRPSFELLYRDILIESLMSTSRVFRVLSPEEWPEVIGLFEPVRATHGQCIIQEGQRFGGFYLVLRGEVSVSRGGTTVKTGLGPGFYVGEVAMLMGKLAQATVRAESTVEFARLEARRFYSLVAGNERLWAHIWQDVQNAQMADLQLVAGVAANV